MKNVPSNALGKMKHQDVFQIYIPPAPQPLEHGCSFPTKLAMWTCRFGLRGWFLWAVLIYISGSPSAAHLIALSATSCKGASAQCLGAAPRNKLELYAQNCRLYAPCLPRLSLVSCFRLHHGPLHGQWRPKHLFYPTPMVSFCRLMFCFSLKNSRLCFCPIYLKHLCIQDDF